MVLSAERPVSGYAELSITGSSRRTAITDVGPEVGGLPPLLRRRVSDRVARAWKPRHRITRRSRLTGFSSTAPSAVVRRVLKVGGAQPESLCERRVEVSALAPQLGSEQEAELDHPPAIGEPALREANVGRTNRSILSRCASSMVKASSREVKAGSRHAGPQTVIDHRKSSGRRVVGPGWTTEPGRQRTSRAGRGSYVGVGESRLYLFRQRGHQLAEPRAALARLVSRSSPPPVVAGAPVKRPRLRRWQSRPRSVVPGHTGLVAGLCRSRLTRKPPAS